MATNHNTLLDALGDGTRRQIVEQLGTGPLPVGELARRLPVSRPAVSQHLKVLKDAGLVVDHADGTRRLYQLDPDGATSLHRWLDEVWTTALDAFKAAAERQPEEQA